MNAFPITGKKLLLDLLASRPLRVALLNAKGKELAAGQGYETGGKALTNIRTGIDGEVAFLAFDNITWKDASFTGARYLLIYDAGNLTSDLRPLTSGTTSVAQIDFGSDKSGQGADFTYKFPAKGGVIRI